MPLPPPLSNASTIASHNQKNIGLSEIVIHDISVKEFEIIRMLLKNLRSFNLEIYKDAYIKRRIGIRIRANNCATAKEYCELLMQNEEETNLLVKTLTIHVSKFFRNPSTFDKLKDEVLPYLFNRSRDKALPIRFWSVGCATGEEPYSLAILIKDFFAEEPSISKLDILATDVNEGVIEVARMGIYSNERLEALHDTTKLRWFMQDTDGYHLYPDIKAMVRFQQADVYNTDTLLKSDLILCRNVLIYLERPEQEKVINGFADALTTGGILVLGKSETLPGEIKRRFKQLCPIERIYQTI